MTRPGTKPRMFAEPPCEIDHGPSMPVGYVDWHTEAERRGKAGWTQSKCSGCDLFAIWASPARAGGDFMTAPNSNDVPPEFHGSKSKSDALRILTELPLRSRKELIAEELGRAGKAAVDARVELERLESLHGVTA